MDLFEQHLEQLVAVRAVEDPRILSWRAEVKRTPTSWLIALAQDPRSGLHHVFDGPDAIAALGQTADGMLIIGAFALAIADELDSRLPIP